MKMFKSIACLLIGASIHAQSPQTPDVISSFLTTSNLKIGQKLNNNINTRQMSKNYAKMKNDYMMEYDKRVFGLKPTYIMFDTINDKINKVSILFQKNEYTIVKLNDALKFYKKIKSNDYENEWISDKYKIKLNNSDTPILTIESHNKIPILKIINAEDAMQRFQRSIVAVISYDKNGKEISQGSGVFNGTGVITNLHVISNSSSIKIKDGPALYDVTNITMHPTRDLAFLETLLIDPTAFINRDPFVSDDYKIGQKVYTIGNPIGLDRSISEGIISGFRNDNGESYIQTTAPISPGSSGGGLFNENGYLIGITTASIEKGQNINFAIQMGNIDTTKFIQYVNRSSRQNLETPQDDGIKKTILQKIILEIELGNNAGALSMCQEAIRQYPDWAEAWGRLGYCQRVLKQLDASIISQNKCLEYAKNKETKLTALSQMIYAYIGKQNNEEAKKLFQQMKEIDYSISTNWYNRQSEYLRSIIGY